MDCKNCGEEIVRCGKGYVHSKSTMQNCKKINKAEPSLKEVGTFECKDWDCCIQGAGCTLSSFPAESPKEDPDIVFENGRFYCKTWRKG